MKQQLADYPIIDADSHVGLGLDTWDYLDDEFKKHPDRPRFVTEEGTNYFLMDRYSWPSYGQPMSYRTPSGHAPGPQGGVDPEYRLGDFMDPEGIECGMLMPGRFMNACALIANPEMGTAQAQAYNDWLHAFCQKVPTRYLGYGVINPGDVPSAVHEMRRCVIELGFPGIYLPPQVVGTRPEDYKILADEHYYPIYEAAHELNVPLAIHAFVDWHVPGHEYNWPRWPSMLWSDIMGFPAHGMQQFMNLVLGGVCEQFPDTRFGIFEAGVGWVPMVIDRFHERAEKFSEAVKHFAPKMRHSAEEYIQRQIWFGFEPEDAFVADFIRWTKAPERILFSADYPHLDFEKGLTKQFLEREDMTPEQRRMAVYDNSVAFFNWEHTARADMGTPNRPVA